MITKFEAGHWYKEPNGRVWMFICDGFENGGKVLRIRCRGCEDITLISINDLNLTTLVEVCYVDGEEMVVGEKYYVSDDSQEDASSSKDERTFFGTVNGQPVFRGLVSIPYRPWEYYVRVDEHAPTYHLVKSIDGQEVSRVEVSEEKAEELEGQ